jgi:Domain of unknown function (DUF4129)
LPILFAAKARASSGNLADYHRRITSAANSLDRLRASYTTSDMWPESQIAATVAQVRNNLPAHETVSADELRVDVDNQWLHDALRDYERMNHADQLSGETIARIVERLRALDERLTEIENAKSADVATKDENKGRVAAILRRPEYEPKVQEPSALERLWIGFIRWLMRILSKLFPQMKPLQPGSAGILSNAAQILVIGIALAVIAYVAWKILPRYFSARSKKKSAKREAGIVLGERLEPDQTAQDLFAQAESLARGGDLRGAIRKAYIAVLCELGERKLISLAQHRTNRDYLQALRETRIYGAMRPLTNSFENHWYGFVPASDDDWNDFRQGYRAVVSKS